ncbi:MAG: DUF1697 domain-containing protein [Patescibacteria group bacterium]|nr:DUF1697 domain-containing protein [Patescibacteria group bacterium]
MALIRGVGPSNPNMRGAKLKAAFEAMGFKGVVPVISSGNVVFRSGSKGVAALEKKIEKGLLKRLGFSRAVIVRSRERLERLVAKDPFKKAKDEPPYYLLVTFFKDGRDEACTALDTSSRDTTKFMAGLDREHGTGITSRTWKTVGRILKAMG